MITFHDLLVSLRLSRIICPQESVNLRHATNQRSECQNNVIHDLVVVLTVNQIKVTTIILVVTTIILVVTYINHKRRPVQECCAHCHCLDGDKEVNPAEDNAAADNPSSKALSAIVSTVSVNDDALEGESVAVSPDGKLDLLGIGERRDSRAWGSTTLVYRSIARRSPIIKNSLLCWKH